MIHSDLQSCLHRHTNELSSHTKTRSVWPTILVKVAGRKKQVVNSHFEASWSSQPWEVCLLYSVKVCVPSVSQWGPAEYLQLNCETCASLFKERILKTYENSCQGQRPRSNIIYIIKTKLESVSLSCKSHRSKTANITILLANSKHQSKLPHLYQSQACHKCKS